MSAVISLLRKASDWGRIGFAVRRLKRANDDERIFAQHALAKAMGDARGFAMKVGQFLAGYDDSNPYRPLVVSVDPMPLNKLKPTLIRQLKKPLEQCFTQIDESTAAASLGQVHHAFLTDGTEVAVKIRYPGIVEAIKAELTLSERLPMKGPVQRWEFNVPDYKNTLRRQLLRETDYSLEMQTQRRFKQNLVVPGLHVPEVFPNYCAPGVLVQSWESGARFSDACTWSKKDRLEIAKTLLMAMFQSLFVHGEVHGDPHAGNFLFRHDESGQAQTVLLDYGCSILINRQNRMALLKLIIACRERSNPEFLSGFSALGFDPIKLRHIADELPSLSHYLFSPFMLDKPFNVKEWHLSQALDELIGERRWWFRAAGPADLFLLLRAFHGLRQQLEQLDVALPWWPLLQNVVGEQMMEHARQLELPSIVSPSPTSSVVYDRAKKLCVRLQENGENRATVDLPAEAAFDLGSIVPGQVLLMLMTHSEVDFPALTQRLKTEGLVPQELFNIALDNGQCRVWLE